MPEQLQAIIRHIDQAVLHLDADGRISVLNPAAERLFGLTSQEAQGLVYTERQWGFLREDGSPCPLDEHPPLIALRIGRPQKEGILGRRHDGGVTWLSVNAQPILPPGQERPTGVVATFTDITRFKRAEEALRENEERFRTLFENASDAIFIHDLNGRFIEVNPAACRHLGYTRVELLQRTVVEIDSPESAALVPQKMAHLFAHGVIASESSHVAKDGRVIPVEFHASLFTLLGQPAVLAIARDITERKRSEDALRRSERRFRQLYDHTPIAYQSLDSDGLILDVNQAWLNCLGYKEEEVLGRWFGSFLVPAFLPHFERNFRCFKEAGSISGVEFQMVKKDGSPILVSINGSIASDAAGNMLRTHCVFLDITEQRRLEAQLRQSQKMEAVGTLAGGIAHDFNNILAAIMGFAEIAAEDARQGEVNPADLDQILISSQRAKELVQRILAFSRKSEPDQTPVNLNRVVGRAVAMLQRTLPKMIAMETDLDDRLPPVWADAAQIEQVLLNLAGNAADAMPEGGKLIIETQGVVLDAEYCRAHLEVRPGRYAQLMVRDTGLGMDAATMERIFEPFFTTKEVGQGTGLGLSTVFGIVKGHGGHIRCYSHPGEGASFTIFLPLPTESPAQAAGEPEMSPGEGEGPRGSEAILVVDDEESLRDLAARTLGDKGYQVLVAASGEEALALYRERGSDLDLVIMDLGMPGMGGHKAMEALLALKPSAKVIIASGYSAHHQVKSALATGAAGYVAKPFRRADLLATVRQALDRS